MNEARAQLIHSIGAERYQAKGLPVPEYIPPAPRRRPRRYPLWAPVLVGVALILLGVGLWLAEVWYLKQIHTVPQPQFPMLPDGGKPVSNLHAHVLHGHSHYIIRRLIFPRLG